MKQVKSKIILSAAVIALFSVSVLQLFAGDEKKGKAPVKIIAANAKTTHCLNLYAVQEPGIFRKYNLDVSIVPVADNIIAISGKLCKLFHSFETDALRFGVDTAKKILKIFF